MNRTKFLIALFLILLIGSFFRFYKLDLQSLWIDELVTMRRANLESIQEIIHMAETIDIHPPGFYIILHYWLRFFGDSETNLRLLSAISGSLAILALFLLVMRLYSKREGLISALLVAVSWYPIYYSQEARPYSLLFLFSIITSIFYWQLVKKFYLKQPSKIIFTVLYILSIVVMSYIHYFGTYLVFLQGFFLFLLAIKNKNYFYEWLLIYLTALMMFLPWLPSFLLQFNGEIASQQPPLKFEELYKYLIYIFNNNKIVLFVTCLFAITLILSLYKNKEMKFIEIFKSLKLETIFLLIWLIVPFIIIVLLSHLEKPVFTFRNMIITYAPMLILFSRLIVKSNFNNLSKNLFVFLFASFLIYNLLFVKEYYSKPTKEQFREVANYVISEYKNDQKTDVLALSYNPLCFDYYFQHFGSEIRVNECVQLENDKAEIDDALSRCYSNNLWLISGHQIPTEEFLGIFNKSYYLVKQKKFLGAQAILYSRK